MKIPFARHIVGAGIAIALAASSMAAMATPLSTLNGQAPIVISHRGSTGYLPEHTIAGYELAVKMGTDYIEPDLQMTKDGVLVAMHDTTLTRTTNVESVLGMRNGSYAVSGYTLAEIKQLTVDPSGTAKSTYPGFTPSDNYANKVPTFQEVIDTAKAMSIQYGREVGIYPEAKQGDNAMADAILSTLIANGYTSQSKVFIQSFSADSIKYLNDKENALDPMYNFKLLVLGSVASINALGLDNINDYADGVGVSTGANFEKLIDDAHAAGLLVHGWTFGNNTAQYLQYLNWGIDGVFSNYTDIAVAARNEVVAAAVPEPSSVLLALLGLGGVIAVTRRRARAEGASGKPVSSTLSMA